MDVGVLLVFPNSEHHFDDYSMCPDNLQFVSYLATSPIKLGHQRATYGGSPPAPLTSSTAPQRLASPTCRPCCGCQKRRAPTLTR